MTLHEYLGVFRSAIEKIDQYGFAESVNIHEEIRAGKQALLHVKVVLVDGSSLHIKEYVDAMYGITKLSYGYQYQDQYKNLLFRYDNAKHKPLLKSKEHKHLTDNQIIEASVPDISELIDEVISYL